MFGLWLRILPITRMDLQPAQKSEEASTRFPEFLDFKLLGEDTWWQTTYFWTLLSDPLRRGRYHRYLCFQLRELKVKEPSGSQRMGPVHHTGVCVA